MAVVTRTSPICALRRGKMQAPLYSGQSPMSHAMATNDRLPAHQQSRQFHPYSPALQLPLSKLNPKQPFCDPLTSVCRGASVRIESPTKSLIGPCPTEGRYNSDQLCRMLLVETRPQLLAQVAANGGSQISCFPREFTAAKMAIRSSITINRSQQVQAFNNP